MKANVGNLDRIIRVLIGALAAFGGFKTGGTTGVILYAVAAVALLTGALGWCGLYQLLGIRTSSGPK